MMAKQFMGFWVLMLFGMAQQAHAFPALHDFAQYRADYEGEPVLMERSVTGYDSLRDVFTVQTVTRFRGSVVESRVAELPRSFLYTPEKVADVIQNCVKREGALGSVNVAGRMMKVCEFYDEDSQLSSIVGPVPFGVIRFQVYVEDETFLDFNLISFRAGQSHF